MSLCTDTPKTYGFSSLLRRGQEGKRRVKKLNPSFSKAKIPSVKENGVNSYLGGNHWGVLGVLGLGRAQLRALGAR